MNPSLKPLPIDLSDLCIAIDAGDQPGHAWFLDRETGGTLLLTAEYEPAENGNLTPEAIAADPTRFVRIPGRDAAEALGEMTDFARQLTDLRLKESLELALGAPRPQRRFKAVLGWLPEELHSWHAFKQQRLEEKARAFLAKCGLAIGPAR